MASRELQSTKTPRVPETVVGDETTANAAYTGTFNSDVRMCLVSNPDTTVPLHVRYGATAATISAYDRLVPPKTTVDVCDGGALRLTSVSVFKPTGFSGTIKVRGLSG